MTYMQKYYQEHKEKLDANSKLYMKSYMNTEAFKKSQAIYKAKSKDKKLEIQRIWRENNRGKVNEYARLGSKTEKGIITRKVCHHNRRIREKGLSVKVVQIVYEDNIKKFGTLTCELCFKPIEFGQDNLEHFVPLSRGGSNQRDNLGIAHGLCNRRKSNKTLEEYNKI